MKKGNGRKGKEMLTEREREVMMLRDKVLLTFKEIALVLGTSQPYAWTVYKKAVERRKAA